MGEKPEPEPADDTYTDAEAERRTDATVRAMIGMKPKPHATPTVKPKGRNRVNKRGADSSKAG